MLAEEGTLIVKTWRCTVCGYLHQGDAPPERCPVCGVDASKFVLVTDEANGGKGTAQSRGLFAEMLETFVPHAVAAHFPTALLPTMVLFLLLYLVTDNASFEISIFYLSAVTLGMIPVTLLTGMWDWKRRYRGVWAPVFRKKLTLSSVLLGLGTIVVCWRWTTPDLLSVGGAAAGLYGLLPFLMM